MARIVDRVSARHEAMRSDPITLEEFGALIAKNQGEVSRTGISITDRRALAISAWYSGVRYLAESLAFLPIHTFKDAGSLTNPKRERVADRPWMTRPESKTRLADELPWAGWVEFAMYSLLHRGNAFSWKVGDENNRIVRLRRLHPDAVRYGLSTDGFKMFGVKMADGSEQPFTTREIFHIPGLSTDGSFGLDPIRNHAKTLGIVAATDEAAESYYANASHPAGIVSVPQEMDEGEADTLKDEWERFHRGLKNRDRIGVLSHGATYTPISIKAEDAQLLTARKFGVIEVARLLRIVPHKLYDLEHATYTNIEHQSIESVMDSIRPWAERFEEWINFDPDLVAPRTFVEIQLEGLLRGDTKARYEGYSLALGAHPWMTPSEPRRLENLPEIAGLDFVPAPLNMGRVGDEPTTSNPEGADAT